MKSYRRRMLILSAMESVVWLLALAWGGFVVSFIMEVFQ